MKKYLLSGLFAVQLVVIGIFWFLNSQKGAEPEPFLNFDANAATKLMVASPEESIEVSKVDGEWTLPDGNPGDAEKIERVISKLAELDSDWPVAKTQSSAERFEVTENAFQKHVVVSSDDDVLADIYLGTSPSFRKVHARHARGGDVFSVEFSNYEAGTSSGSWLNKKLLQPDGPISAIERVGSYQLVNEEEGGWTADSGVELDENKVRSFVDRFESLSVFKISDRDISEIQNPIEYILHDDAGTHTLKIYHIEISNDWVVTSDRFESNFEIASYQGPDLQKALIDLAPDVEEEETNSEEDTVPEDIIDADQ